MKVEITTPTGVTRSLPLDSLSNLPNLVRGSDARRFTLTVELDSREDTEQLAAALPVLAECFIWKKGS